MPNEEEELRPDVGVRNPYALVNVLKEKVKKGSSVDWKSEMSKERAGIQNNTKKILYEELFPFVTDLSLTPRDEANDDDYNTFYCNLFDPRYCNLLFRSEAVLPAGTYITDTCSHTDLPLERNIKTYTDPIQGAGRDCYFIAAICSLAWVQRKRFDIPDGSLINITFYPSSTTSEATTVTKHLLFDSGNNIVGARSSEDEIWPSIYEKAYATASFNNLAIVNTNCRDITQFSGGNPITALMHLTKKIPQYRQNATFSTGYAIYDFITRYNCYMKKTKYPMTAFTYDPTNTPPPAGVVYSDDTILANHSYSILGTLADGSVYYIVLRNPYGPTRGGDPNSPTPIYPGVWTNVGDYQFEGGQPISGSIHDIQLSMDDGIFALEANYFKNYFQTFGWVYI